MNKGQKDDAICTMMVLAQEVAKDFNLTFDEAYGRVSWALMGTVIINEINLQIEYQLGKEVKI